MLLIVLGKLFGLASFVSTKPVVAKCVLRVQMIGVYETIKRMGGGGEVTSNEHKYHRQYVSKRRMGGPLERMGREFS